jgi:hypothetical protein
LALALALPSVAAARLDNSPGPWPGAGTCDVLIGGHIVACASQHPVGGSARRAASEKRAAASVSAATANARQRAAARRGEANTALSNPYVEQKVTIPESVGVNRTGIPAGGF